MGNWYYAEGNPQGNPQRHGPLPEADLIELFRNNRIGLNTWVWREGLQQWQPLSACVSELGLSASAPPPLPQTPARVAAPVATPPKSGLSGCMIALIVAAVCCIPVVAILAAIALPAYQDYVLRAKVAEAVMLTEPLKAEIADFHERENRCAGNGDEGFGTESSYATAQIASIRLGSFENEKCGFELRLRNTNSNRIDGKPIWLEYDADDGSWSCTSEIDNRYLPQTCRRPVVVDAPRMG
jgi:type IV pilus assembly protein PilA